MSLLLTYQQLWSLNMSKLSEPITNNNINLATMGLKELYKTGKQLFNASHYNESIVYLETALPLVKALPNESSYPAFYGVLAGNYSELGNLDKAEYYATYGIKLNEVTPDKGCLAVLKSLKSTKEYQHARKESEQARKESEQARKESEQARKESEQARKELASVRTNIAELQIKRDALGKQIDSDIEKVIKGDFSSQVQNPSTNTNSLKK